VEGRNIVLSIFVLAMSISVHESSHALVADRCGDDTGRLKGRISLNPLDHIDPFGTVLFPALCVMMGLAPFGWAKPVPVNPGNLRRPRRDRALVSAAGPGSNLLLAVGCLVVSVVLAPVLSQGGMPLGRAFGTLLVQGIIINMLLCVFNLIPFPPLDGHGILEYFLSRDAVRWFRQNQSIIQIVLIAFIFLGPIGLIISPFINTMLRFQVLLVNLFWGPDVVRQIGELIRHAMA
jgi:Zn-dependent protease